MLLLSPAGKNKRNNQSKAEQWNAVEAVAAKHGTQTSRDDWRLATCVYLAESREEAWRDVEATLMATRNNLFDRLENALRGLPLAAGQ